MEDTIEKRILKSNLSDEDKIEIIKRLSSNKEFIYVPQPVYPQTVPYCYTTATSNTLNGKRSFE